MTTSLLNNEKSIAYGDTIYARVSYMGQQILNFQLSDSNSFSQIVERVRGQLKGISGLVKITLRNASQGWSSEHWCPVFRA